ncbi:hypothetical protein SB724_20550, partial [Bacillus sp. SIMBA_031]
MRNKRRAHMLTCEEPPLSAHIGERLIEIVAFFFLATQKGDALTILADTGKGIPKFRFNLIFCFGDPNEPPP